jgi:hypothetical protein
VVYSGGRDKGVYCTHMGLRKAWLLAREQQPVRDIVSSIVQGAREGGGCESVWVCTKFKYRLSSGSLS